MLHHETRTKSLWTTIVLAAAAAVALVGSPSTTEAAWDGTQTVRLGDLITAEFVGPPLAEAHRYSFYVMKDTVMNTTITVNSSSAGLVPELTLFAADETQVDLGAAQNGNKIKNFKFLTSGSYYLRVRATAGTGGYKLDTKAKQPAKITGSTTTGAFAFDAGADVVLGGNVKKSKGSTAKPVVTALTYNGGSVDLGAYVNTSKFSKLKMPVNATYTLAINPGTAGQSVDVTLNFTFPKRKTWQFGFIEDTEGLASQNREKWLTSAHADHTAEAFIHWNEDNPPQVPTSCARCHSTPGYRDYLGADGSAPNVVDKPAPVGTVVECDACHNDQALALTAVTFPSGLTVSGLGKEARCMVCHQGRESTVSVEKSVDASTKSYKVTNSETTGAGLVGTGVAIAAGTTFTDTGAAFDAAGVGSDGSYYLHFVANPVYLNGAAGVVSTKNIYRVQILAAAGDSLTLATPLAAETPASGKSFQYTVYQMKSEDTVSAQLFKPLKFLNVHYFAAGASLYGREAAGAYEYEEPNGAAQDVVLTPMTQRRGYDRKFTHVASKDTCIECHDPHTQKVRVSECAECHVNEFGNPVATYEDLRAIRMAGTVDDFNGNGDTIEGVWYEIKGLESVLYAAMQSYSTNVCGSTISYNPDAYPYFFVAGTNTGFTAWTAKLVRAAYNYQYAQKDPGAFAHNGKFIVAFLYDSIEDLNETLAALPTPAPVPNFENLVRNDPGHFDSDGEPYRHWDEDSDHLVDPSCARCHSIEGFQFVVKYGLDTTVPANLAAGLSCETCHVAGTNFAPRAQNPNPDGMPERVYVKSVAFPYPSTATSTQITAVTINNAAKGTPEQDDSYICMTCHRGRESKLTLDAADPTGATTKFTLSFKNAHYLGAGAVLYGNKAAGMYQYNGNLYSQRWDHDQGYSQPYPAASWYRAQCKFCHMQEGSHSFEPEISSTCTYCHVDSTSVDDLTPAFRPEDNYDGNQATKPKAELGVFQARLLAAIQKWCKDATDANNGSLATYVVYNPAAYPYFCVDTNKNGVWDAGETSAAKFDTKTFRASFNYNFSVKEPGSWAHNPKYVFQVLYDSIKDLNGDLTGLVRPTTP
jgi:hypothetical protein